MSQWIDCNFIIILLSRGTSKATLQSYRYTYTQGDALISLETVKLYSCMWALTSEIGHSLYPHIFCYQWILQQIISPSGFTVSFHTFISSYLSNVRVNWMQAWTWRIFHRTLLHLVPWLEQRVNHHHFGHLFRVVYDYAVEAHEELLRHVVDE